MFKVNDVVRLVFRRENGDETIYAQIQNIDESRTEDSQGRSGVFFWYMSISDGQQGSAWFLLNHRNSGLIRAEVVPDRDLDRVQKATAPTAEYTSQRTTIGTGRVIAPAKQTSTRVGFNPLGRNG